jgi:hypothetical protein
MKKEKAWFFWIALGVRRKLDLYRSASLISSDIQYVSGPVMLTARRTDIYPEHTLLEC